MKKIVDFRTAKSLNLTIKCETCIYVEDDGRYSPNGRCHRRSPNTLHNNLVGRTRSSASDYNRWYPQIDPGSGWCGEWVGLIDVKQGVLREEAEEEEDIEEEYVYYTYTVK